VAMVRGLGRRFGVVINRADCGDRGVREYCDRENIPVLLELPDDRRVAEAYSCGQMAVKVLSDWAEHMRGLWGRVCERQHGRRPE